METEDPPLATIGGQIAAPHPRQPPATAPPPAPPTSAAFRAGEIARGRSVIVNDAQLFRPLRGVITEEMVRAILSMASASVSARAIAHILSSPDHAASLAALDIDALPEPRCVTLLLPACLSDERAATFWGYAPAVTELRHLLEHGQEEEARHRLAQIVGPRVPQREYPGGVRVLRSPQSVNFDFPAWLRVVEAGLAGIQQSRRIGVAPRGTMFSTTVEIREGGNSVLGRIVGPDKRRVSALARRAIARGRDAVFQRALLDGGCSWENV